MPIFSRKDTSILFIHVPKTGGTSIEHFVRDFADVLLFNDRSISGFPCSAQHWHGEILRRMFSSREPFSDVFMVVRHPLDRMISEYFSRLGGKLSARRGGPPSFERWARRTLKRYRRDNFTYDNHIRPQSEFEAFSPRIFKFEDGFADIQEFLKERFGVVQGHEVGRLNATRRDLAEIAISERLKGQIYEMYRSDFDLYDYAIS